jgi:UDPglucose 6-dehydrogenase
MKVTVVGTGYVGLVTGAILADFGNQVFCLDTNEEKINQLKSGRVPFYEPGLEEIVKRNAEAQRLIFTTSYKESVIYSEVVFICVGTPPKRNGEADLSFVKSAVKSVAENLADYTVVVGKSTVPVGTGEKMTELIKKFKSKRAKFDWVSNPEFLREGSAVFDTLHPDRIVIGSESEEAKEVMLELHKPIDGLALLTDVKSAEMIKYGANAFLSTKISFANAMANICEKVGADVESVMDGIGYDRRIGRPFLYPGIGYGGSCFPKDVLALIDIAKRSGYNFKLLKAVDEINKERASLFVAKLEKALGGLGGKTVAILGLSFKPNTDDMREAPSLKVIKMLRERGAEVRAYDPVARENARKLMPEATHCVNIYEAVDGAEALCVLTEWNEFKEIDLEKIKKLLKNPIVVDGRNIYDPIRMKELGFSYFGIGRS